MATSVFKFGKWTIEPTGMGCFMNPPGDAEHYYHVNHPRMSASLRAALESDIPAPVRKVVQSLLDANKPVLTEEWVREVYRYFKGCYSPDGADRIASHCVIDQTNTKLPLEYHLAHMHINEWFPGYGVRQDLLY